MPTTETEQSLSPLGERVVRIANFHTRAESHRASFEENAIRAGEELLEAQEELDADLGWGEWLDENFPGTRSQAYDYMRRAREYQDAEIAVGLREWCEHVGAQHRAREAEKKGRLSRMRLEARALALRRGEGFNSGGRRVRQKLSYKEIADYLGITRRQAYRLVNGAREREREANARRRSAAASQGAETRKVKRAAKKAGGAMANLYADAERMQDVLAQAHDEATDPEARKALDLAGRHYRKMRDEIVRALGVS